VRVVANAPDASGRTGFGPSGSRLITLAPGQEMENVDFKLVVHARIAGKVLDQNKEPVVGISVMLIAREYFHGALRLVFASAGFTDDQGEYTIGRVQPGRAYGVLAAKRVRTLPAISDEPANPEARLPAIVPTYYPNARSIDGAELLVLRPGELREGVDIRLARSASFCIDAKFEGTPGPKGLPFTIAETQPASGRVDQGAMYMVMPRGRTTADGTARICELHPGEYDLTASESSGTGSGGTAMFGSTIVTIGDRDVAGVRVPLRPRMPVKGEVVFDGPAPETPLTTQLAIDVEAITRTERGSERPGIPGTFEFAGGLVMDEFAVEISRVPPGIYIKDVQYGDRSILHGTMRVGSAAGDAALKIVLARDGGAVSAQVTGKDSQPEADCTVVVMPENAPNEAVFAAMLVTGKTDQGGRWSSPTLAPGKYLALALRDRIDRSPETITKLWKARNRAESIDLDKNASVKLTVRGLE
jgi:hypothetical protein